MKSLVLLAAAVAFVSATAAEAKGVRIRLGGPRTSAPAPKPPQPMTTAPTVSPRTGGVVLVPAIGLGGSRASAAPSDSRRSAAQNWDVPQARQATPEWFAAAAAEAARTASPGERPVQAPRTQKASFQCPPERLVGGFCVLN